MKRKRKMTRREKMMKKDDARTRTKEKVKK